MMWTHVEGRGRGDHFPLAQLSLLPLALIRSEGGGAAGEREEAPPRRSSRGVRTSFFFFLLTSLSCTAEDQTPTILTPTLHHRDPPPLTFVRMEMRAKPPLSPLHRCPVDSRSQSGLHMHTMFLRS